MIEGMFNFWKNGSNVYVRNIVLKTINWCSISNDFTVNACTCMCTMTSTTAIVFTMCVSCSFQTWLHVIIRGMFIHTKSIKMSWLRDESDAKQTTATKAPLIESKR